ncbi:hypothetical protein EI94DRAFT_1748955 [Lactarius quietus]|nr:hypothetical protein EI94DRAFT_1748955 [Lactarius quietus]
MALRATEWALTRKPFRRYEPFAEGQHTPSLMRTRPPPPSLVAVFFKLLFKLTVYDIAHYLIQHIRPSLDTPTGDTLFDPNLHPVPRVALALFFTLCGGVVVYTIIDAMYHASTLVGRRSPPALDVHSITDFWSFRWHQFFRHTFVTFGAHPGGAILGRPGALFGAFGVSAMLHYIGLWGLGRGTEFSSSSFFLLMGVGAALEHVWWLATGKRVCGLWGWAWTMMWTLSWGTFLLDGWARHGMIACDFFPGQRPGKLIVDAIISLITNK